MKVIIAGGRNFDDYDYMIECINQLIDDGVIDQDTMEIVSGMARGADSLAVRLAEDNDIPLHEFYAKWDKLGNFAGIRRNMDMGRFADVLVAFWDTKSVGTKHMIEYMESLKKPVYVFNY